MKLGFIGLGIMGAPMALHLINAGHTVYVSAARRVPDAIKASAAVPCATVQEVASHAEVIFLMVPDTPDVESVLFGDSGVAAALEGAGGERKIVVDMSSVSPMATPAPPKRPSRS